MTVWTSDIYAIAEKRLERGVNRWFMSRKFDAAPSMYQITAKTLESVGKM